MDRADDASLAVYVHWPFCLSKCPYCDFNSHVADTIDHGAWRRAYAAEIAHAAAMLPGRTVTSVFFGGGTPSLMAPETTASVLDAVAGAWTMAPDAEITLEANPTSVEAGRFRSFRAAGVNRVSLGVQALDDRDLVFLGRGHDRGQAIAAVETARSVFPRYSFDLIYARPGQTVAAWRAELDEALAMAGDHLSLYQLTIERGTPFYSRHRDGGFVLPDEDTAAALYETTQNVLETAGLPAYEVSNHATRGGASRHNLAYWRYQDYVGIGPGAHGRHRGAGQTIATERHHRPADWLAAVATEGHGLKRHDALAPADVAAELLMMGLRLREGIGLAYAEERTGAPLERWLRSGALDRCRAAGYLAIEDGRMRATETGRPLLNALLAELLA